MQPHMYFCMYILYKFYKNSIFLQTFPVVTNNFMGIFLIVLYQFYKNCIVLQTLFVVTYKIIGNLFYIIYQTYTNDIFFLFIL